MPQSISETSEITPEPNMHKSELSRLLQKYSQGECTPDEMAALETWFLSMEINPDDTRLLNKHQDAMLNKKMLIEIKSKIKAYDNHDAPFRFAILMKIAASLLLVVTIAGVLILLNKPSLLPNRESISFFSKRTNVTVTNITKKDTLVSLADGTVVALQPGGGIVYPEKFEPGIRNIKLTGAAFFDVAKDSSRPFIITTKNITVKVLGTSFCVKAYEDAREEVVTVKTGRVSVIRSQRHGDGKDEVILTPNQEVVYSTVNENFLKKIVSIPRIILEKPTLFEMNYENTPVEKIFTMLEENYGIDIVFDPIVLSSCTLTTSMAEEGFYERIEIICRAIGAQYEARDATIVIKSTGCH